MTNGYWIAHVDVQNADAFQRYAAANGKALAKHGARFLVRGGQFEVAEGSARSRTVVVEFPSYADANACWHSQEYQAAKALQEGGATVVDDG